jgi:hypothetical protein
LERRLLQSLQMRSRATHCGAGTILSISAAFVLLLSVTVSPTKLPQTVVCGFRWLTALPCPFCGLTRAFVAIGHGDLQHAWRFNPFSFPLYALAVCVALRPLYARYTPRTWQKPWTALRRPIFALLVAAGVFVHGVMRVVLHASSGN